MGATMGAFRIVALWYHEIGESALGTELLVGVVPFVSIRPCQTG